MKKAGIVDYKKFALEVLKIVKNQSLLKFFLMKLMTWSDKQEISSWGENVYVKIPITNSKKIKTNNLVKKLSDDKIKCNVTAVFTLDQVKDVYESANNETDLII